MVLFSGWVAFLAIVVHLGTSDANRCEDNPIGLADTSVFPEGQFQVTAMDMPLFDTSPPAIVNSTGWCANTTSDPNPEIIIHFGRIIRLCGINTAGVGFSYLENYELSFSLDGVAFSDDETIDRTSDLQNDHFYELSSPKRAISIKLTFGDFANDSCIGNLELFERRGRCGNHPLGISDPFIIPDASIAVSSNSINKNDIRMSTVSVWCSSDLYNESDVTINLGEAMTICALETEGQSGTLNYLDSFKVQFSNDGASFNDYEENTQTREFINIRNGEREFHFLPTSPIAQYIRIRSFSEDATTMNTFCTKLELYRIGAEVEDSGTCFKEMVPFTSVSANSGQSPSADEIRLDSDSGWCSSVFTGEQYLQIDFGSVHSVCAVAVQGSSTNPDDYPEMFELSFAVVNTNDWVIYSEDPPQYNDREYLISPWDGNAIVKRKLASSVPAQSMRFWIREFTGSQACLRVAVFGRKALDVTCHPNGTAFVNVSLGVLGPEITNLTLNDSSCVYIVPSNEGNFVFSFNLNSCDTRASGSDNNYLNFSNTVIGISGSTPGATTLYPDMRFLVECSYDRNDVLNENWIPLHEVSDTADGDGVFTFTFGLYVDPNHESSYLGQILELLTPVFGKVKVYTGDPNTLLMIVRAWATPTTDRDDANNVTLIDDNCQVVTNDTVPFNFACALDSLEQEFSFRAFSFVVDSGEVYIHADLRVCLNELGNECTTSCIGCGGLADRKRRSTTTSWEANSNANMYSIDFPPLKIKGDQETRDSPLSPQKGNEGLTTTAVVIIAISGVLALGVICVTGFIIKRRGISKKYASDRAGLEPTIQYLPSDPQINTASEA